jgi:hypothetical protein
VQASLPDLWSRMEISVWHKAKISNATVPRQGVPDLWLQNTNEHSKLSRFHILKKSAFS